MLTISGIHHVALICADYERSKRFYVEVLGLPVIREVWRADRRCSGEGWLYAIRTLGYTRHLNDQYRPHLEKPRMFLRHLALAMLFMLSAMSASASDYYVIINNQTGYTINYVYISPGKAKNWEEDVLGDKVLPHGSTQRVNLNGELYFPFPGVGNDRTLRIFGYFDAGNVWGEDETPTLASFRASAGLGLSWISPVGPLKLSWGQPVRKFPQDRIQRFQFQIGTAF